MAVVIVMFLVTIIAHGVTPDLECWGCWGIGGIDSHLCNDTSNFQVRKCTKDQTMCRDIVVEETRYMMKDCTSEEEWNNELKPWVEKENGLFYLCNTTKCNTRIWQDYFPVVAKNNAQIETPNLPKTPAPEEVKVPKIPAPEVVNAPRTPAPEGVKVTLKKCHKLPSTPSPLG